MGLKTLQMRKTTGIMTETQRMSWQWIITTGMVILGAAIGYGVGLEKQNSKIQLVAKEVEWNKREMAEVKADVKEIKHTVRAIEMLVNQ